MPPTLHELGIDQLSIDDRIALAQAIWQSIEEESPPSFLTESQRKELERRLAEHESNPNDVVSWEQIQTEAHDRWRK